MHASRCASSHSAQGTMWEARSKAGSVMPVIGQQPPIIHQRSAEDVLANALDDNPFGLGRLR
jgi:hypothetical protein